MKRFYILIAIICSVFTVKAQFGVGGGSTIVGKISGTLIDSVSKKPLDYASVGLYRVGGKSPITGAITDEKGNFKINGVHPGTYNIVITFIGYPTKTFGPVVTTDSKPDKNVGEINVSPGAKMLKEVAIAGQAPLVENHIDKLVYNAEKDLTAVGGNATDVLQKVPLVGVDINGNVSLRGDANVRVLINGRPSGATSASLSDVLKAIPADQIKTIEVITSPSAKYDAEGTAGIINIVTKQSNISGLSGSVSGGLGTRQNNGNANINYKKNRLSVSANLGGNFTWPQTSITQFTQDFHPSDTMHTSQITNGTSLVKRHSYIGSASVSYDFNKYNNLTSDVHFYNAGFNTDANSTTNKTDYFNAANDNSYNTYNIGQNAFRGFDWDLNYTRKFKKEGEELSLSTQWSHGSVVTDYNTVYSSTFPNQEDNINAVTNEYTFQADYTLPITKKLKWETGAKSILRKINSTSDIYAPDNSGVFVFDPVNSNLYNYDQNVYAAYSEFTITLPKGYTVLAGVRDENTDINGDPVNSVQVGLSPFTQNYNTFVPNLTIQKQLTPTQTVKLTYSKRISRPSLQQLNPFDNKSNILGQTEGNPTLGPEISQAIELNYNTFIKSSVINTSIYYKHINGLIESFASPVIVPVDVNGTAVNEQGTVTQSMNIGQNNSIGASLFGSINPIKILTIRGSINAFTYKPDPSGIFHLLATENGTYIEYNAFLSASVNLNNGFIAETFARESSQVRTIQGTTPIFTILGAGVRKQIMKKKASIGINTLEPFSKYKNFDSNISSPGFSQTSHFAFPFRSVGLTFSYTFGKLTFSNPTQKKGDVDEEKQGDQSGMGGGGSR